MALEALKRNGHNLHIGEFPMEGKYGIPRLSPVRLPERLNWLPFNCARTDKRRSAHGIHFFVDDYLFERVWNDPARYALLLSDFRAVMTPDFSLFTDYPLPVQLYNHWRKHLLGAVLLPCRTNLMLVVWPYTAFHTPKLSATSSRLENDCRMPKLCRVPA